MTAPTKTAMHRPAVKRRRFRHDSITALDLFSGFGGLTQGIERAGFDVIMAANHNEYKVSVHEANHPSTEHWIADLVDKDAADYHSARDLPAADLLVAGVSCFAAGSLVLARRGLVPIEDIVVGDEVWTHRARWRPVTHTSAVERPTITISATTPITCTPDHPFWAAVAEREYQPRRKYQPLDGARCLECDGPAPQFMATSKARLYCSTTCKRAADQRRALDTLGKRREIRADSLAGMFVGSPILDSDGTELPVIDGLGAITVDVAWMLGRWVGDGWVSRRPERNNAWSRVTICGSHAESDGLGKELSRLALPWNRTRQRTTDIFHVNRVGLAAFIVDNFGHGATGKRVPTWMLFAPKKIRQSFVDGYMSADGHESRDGLRIQSATVSKELAVAMRLLLTSLDYYATVTFAPKTATAVIEERIVRQRPQWVVTAHKCRDRRPKHRDADGYRWGRASGTVARGETVTVYNMTVADDHTYTVDGVIVHNCVNHSAANTKKAYAQGMSLFDLDDPEFEEAVTRSERDRATANCVLHYAAQHHPRLILVECTTELQSWGPAVPGRKKVGDGTTYRWWLKQFEILGYRYRVLYLNSMFFGVPQSRDRLYIAFWDRKLPTPDLDHRPPAWCGRCDEIVEAKWSWKTRVPPSGTVRYGVQYNYRCPRCHTEVQPPATPSLHALDLTNLGTRIGDRKKPLAAATMARAQRCMERFAEFPAVLMPAKANHGTEKHPWQPMDTVTTTPEKAVLVAVHNYQGSARGVDQALPTQTSAETLSVLSAGVLPFRKHTIPTTHVEPMPTQTAEQIPGLLTAAGLVGFNEGIDRRVKSVGEPLQTVTAAGKHQGVLFGGWIKNNGNIDEAKYRAHPFSDPFGAMVSQPAVSVLTAEWRAMLADRRLEDCYLRMLGAHEIGRGCGFDVNFPDHEGTFICWGSERDQTDGFGNAVSPPVGWWIGDRLRAVLHREQVAS